MSADDSPEQKLGPSPENDGRVPGDWKTRYQDPLARREILFEASYLGFLLLLCPILIFILFLKCRGCLFGLTESETFTLNTYALAALAGTFGGTLFGIKWLIHSVARHIWNIDRKLWRIFTPLASGALGATFIAMISGGVLTIFDAQAVNKRTLVFSIAFLVGHFSDPALAKLSDVALSLFGSSGRFAKKD